jgi:PilZ domain
MYKFILSCYYWPAREGVLRLRVTQIQYDERNLGDLNYSQIARPSALNKISPIERRRTPRLKATCDAELLTSVAILDNDEQSPVGSLIFLGRTLDVSISGLAIVLPSTPVDERYCNEATRLRLLLHLPAGTVRLEVNPVRCAPLNADDRAMGYLLGAQIVSTDQNRLQFDDYLRAISTSTAET